MRMLWLPAIGVALSGLSGIVAAASTTTAAVSIPKDIRLPLDVDVAVYLPAHLRKNHQLFSGVGVVQSGRALEDSVLDISRSLFVSSRIADTGADFAYGLIISLHPEVKFENQSLTYAMNYSVFGSDKTRLLSGRQSASITLNGFNSGGDVIGRLSRRATELALDEVVSNLRPDRSKFPSAANLKEQQLDFVVNKDKPWTSGTGFYLNATGQVMTAAHVIHDCVVIEVGEADRVSRATLVALSNLLDIAVLDTGVPTTHFLPFRREETYELGEQVTNVGYPLQPILSDSPNLTRGNVSSRGGLLGSVGQFQFSAPVQPGSSGGPVVSDGGELLGIAVSTLNVGALAKVGVVPQNVNFALDARYAAMFLRKSGLVFTEVEPNPKGDLHTANEAALGAVVSIKCYQ